MTLLLRWRRPDPPIQLRWRGLDGATADAIAQGADPAPIAAIVGPPGLSGDAASAAAEAVADVALPAGMPLAISRANGHLVKADAAAKPVAFVAGLAAADTSVGFVGSAVRGPLTLDDWTAAAGSAALLPGQTYFLGADGGLTTTPPASPNCITAIGIAASPTTLIIDPENPIQL